MRGGVDGRVQQQVDPPVDENGSRRGRRVSGWAGCFVAGRAVGSSPDPAAPPQESQQCPRSNTWTGCASPDSAPARCWSPCALINAPSPFQKRPLSPQANPLICVQPSGGFRALPPLTTDPPTLPVRSPTIGASDTHHQSSMLSQLPRLLGLAALLAVLAAGAPLPREQG